MAEENIREMYERLMDYEQSVHLRNRKRISIGIRCLWIIPLVFMFLMFITERSKLVFLVLWIVSLFGIAVYLVTIEYMDFNLQEKMHEIKGEEGEIEGLIPIEGVEERIIQTTELLEEKRDNLQESIQTKKDSLQENLQERKDTMQEKKEYRKEKKADILKKIKQVRKENNEDALEEEEDSNEEHD